MALHLTPTCPYAKKRERVAPWTRLSLKCLCHYKICDSWCSNGAFWRNRGVNKKAEMTIIKQNALVLFALTSGYSLTGTNSFSCRWTMAPTGSGSSRGGLSTRPFTVSLYMSLRTLLISEKHKSDQVSVWVHNFSGFVSDITKVLNMEHINCNLT